MLQKFRSKVRSRFVPQPDEVTCQAACIAMALNSSDVHGIRDRLLSIGAAGDPDVMAEVLKAELGDRYSLDRDASLAEARQYLKQGCFLITHGYYTLSGHVIAINGLESDPKTSSHRFHVKDPWSEFNHPAWAYNLGSTGYEGYYSAHGIYAACVASTSVSHAREIYQRGELDSSKKNMWLHIIQP